MFILIICRYVPQCVGGSKRYVYWLMSPLCNSTIRPETIYFVYQSCGYHMTNDHCMAIMYPLYDNHVISLVMCLPSDHHVPTM